MADFEDANDELDVQALIDRHFTDRSRTVLKLALNAAANLGHVHVAPEHILIALVAEGVGVAGHVLRYLDTSETEVTHAVERVVGRGNAHDEHIVRPFTSDADQLVHDALDEAFALRHNYVGTEHLILALTRDAQVTATKVFSAVELNPKEIRDEVLMLLGHKS